MRAGRVLVALAVVVAVSAWMLLRDTGGDDSAPARIASDRVSDVALTDSALLPAAGARKAAAPMPEPGGLAESAGVSSTTSSAGATEPALTVAGRVVDERQQPLAGVTVIVGTGRGDLNNKAWRYARGGLEDVAERALTGDDGRFEVPIAAGKLPSADDDVPLELRVVLLHAQHATRVVSVEGVVAQRFDTGDLGLEPGAVLTGRVVTEDRTPVQNADLLVQNPVDSTLALAVADSAEDEQVRQGFLMSRSAADGRFTIEGLRPGLAHLNASKPDVAETRLRELQVSAVEPLDVGDVVLSAGFELAGVVVGEDGLPIASAMVNVQRPRAPEQAAADAAARTSSGSAGQTRAGAASDAEGRFRVRGLAAGLYDVHASAPGRAWTRVFGVSAGSADVRVVMPQLGTLLVTVLDAGTSAPVERATITATMPKTERFQPWSNGQFVVSSDGQPPGRYAVAGAGPEGTELTVRAEGYVELTQLAPGVQGRQTVELELRLRPELTAFGVVMDEAGVPVAGAVVSTYAPGQRGGSSAPTDATGAFRVGGLEPGEWQIGAYAPGFVDSEPMDVSVPPGGLRNPLTLVLQRNGDIVGTVYDADGLPAAGLRVLGVRRDAEGTTWFERRDLLRDAAQFPVSLVQSSTSDAEGRYAFPALPPGRYAVWLGRDEQVDLDLGALWSLVGEPLAGAAAFFVTVEPGATAVLDLHLPRASSLHGRVTVQGVPAGGNPVVAVLADVDYRTMRPRFKLSTVTDATGGYTLALPFPGRYALMAFARDVPVPLVRVFDVREGQTVLADLALRGADLQLRVVDDPAGTPLEGVELELGCSPNAEGQQPAGSLLWQNAFSSVADSYFEGAPTEPFRMTTDAEGRCPLRCLEPGEYTLWLEHDGYLETSALFTVSGTGDPAPLAIAMRRGVRIAGTLRAAGLSPLPSVHVGLATEGGTIMHWAELDGAHFEFEPAEPGRYEIRVVSQADHEQVLASRALTVGAEGSDELVITLDR